VRTFWPALAKGAPAGLAGMGFLGATWYNPRGPNRRKPKEYPQLLSREGNVQPLVGLIMGSRSDWETLGHAAQTLEALGVPYEARVVSAHRTPDLLMEYASSAEARGLEVLIAGAGGAAHLPGMAAAKTVLPVLGVPVESKALHGLDSLLSIVQMPAGVPVATLAIGRAGAVNAALLAASILGCKYPSFRDAVRRHRQKQTEEVLAHPDPREGA
jgi:5-(carboxyamino)imidazole ribonucleotide mutase